MNIILAITGSSGVVYGKRLLEVCMEKGLETSLIISPAAEKVIEIELEEDPSDLREKATVSYGYKEIGAPISSGSVKNEVMVIAPCSMKTIGSIANGVTGNLITRAADVTLKEGRKLILLPRETPLHSIHLENLTKLSKNGATIIPAAPGFYQKPDSVDELIDFIVGKVLDQMGIKHNLYKPWQGFEK